MRKKKYYIEKEVRDWDSIVIGSFLTFGGFLFILCFFYMFFDMNKPFFQFLSFMGAMLSSSFMMLGLYFLANAETQTEEVEIKVK